MATRRPHAGHEIQITGIPDYADTVGSGEAPVLRRCRTVGGLHEVGLRLRCLLRLVARLLADSARGGPPPSGPRRGSCLWRPVHRRPAGADPRIRLRPGCERQDRRADRRRVRCGLRAADRRRLLRDGLRSRRPRGRRPAPDRPGPGRRAGRGAAAGVLRRRAQPVRPGHLRAHRRRGRSRRGQRGHGPAVARDRAAVEADFRRVAALGVDGYPTLLAVHGDQITVLARGHATAEEVEQRLSSLRAVPAA